MKTGWEMIIINKEEKKRRERKQFYLSTAAKSATETKTMKKKIPIRL